MERLDKVLRHETHLHRQIDTAVKMLNKDAPALYARRVRDEVLEEVMLSERECRESVRDETEVDLETRGRLRRIRKATEAAAAALSQAPLDAEPLDTCRASQSAENCQNEPTALPMARAEGADEKEEEEAGESGWGRTTTQNRRNEPCPWTQDGHLAFPALFPHTPAQRSA